jgi:hypothetical protein
MNPIAYQRLQLALKRLIRKPSPQALRNVRAAAKRV